MTRTSSAEGVIVRFVRPVDPAKAGDEAADFLTANPDVQGTFTEWEVPATGIKSA